MKKIFLISLSLIICFSAFADEQALIQEANELYQQGKYNEAIEKYNEVVSGGYQAAELYYNIGNSYYKLKKYTFAILYYEKAKKLKPTDDDINQNLNLVTHNFVSDNIKEVPEFFVNRWVEQFLQLTSADTWAYISIACFILFLFFLSIFLYSRRVGMKKTALPIAVFVLLFSVISFFSALKQKSVTMGHTEAIIFTPTVSVKSSPDQTGTELFILHEGTKVEIQDTISGWCEIKIRSGNIGWLKRSDIKKI